VEGQHILVPDLTFRRDINLNARLSLRDGNALIRSGHIKCSVFEMIRYSSYGTANFTKRFPAPDNDDPLRAAYDELLQLRKRVTIAEANATKSYTGSKADRSKAEVKRTR
jgi:hypothetical protein